MPDVYHFQPLSEDLLKAGNLRLPPFPPREPNDQNQNDVPKVYTNQQDTGEIKGFIFKQLHEFDEYARNDPSSFLISNPGWIVNPLLQYSAYVSSVYGRNGIIKLSESIYER